MNKQQIEKLNRILNDKTSGSSEILLALNRFLKAGINNRKLIDSSLTEARKKLSHFAAINNYIHNLTHLVVKNDIENIQINQKIQHIKT